MCLCVFVYVSVSECVCVRVRARECVCEATDRQTEKHIEMVVQRERKRGNKYIKTNREG